MLLLINVMILTVPWKTGIGLTGLMWFNPANSSTPIGSTTTLDLQLDNISNVFGAQVEMAFDPDVLEVVGGAITPGTCPQPDFVVTNTADNIAGTIEYTLTQLNPTPPCNGGIMASIDFLCKLEDADTLVSITSSLISDPDGTPIAHTTQNATISCVEGSSPLLSFEPQNLTIGLGEEIIVDVEIEDVNNLFGVQMEISFNPNYLQIIDTDTSSPGIQIIPGTCPAPDFILQNSASNTLGNVEYSATSLSPTSPCYGNGLVASIKFEAIAEGKSDINFTSWILADPDGLSIATLTQNGSITVKNQRMIFLPLVIK